MRQQFLALVMLIAGYMPHTAHWATFVCQTQVNCEDTGTQLTVQTVLHGVAVHVNSSVCAVKTVC